MLNAEIMDQTICGDGDGEKYKEGMPKGDLVGLCEGDYEDLLWDDAQFRDQWKVRIMGEAV